MESKHTSMSSTATASSYDLEKAVVEQHVEYQPDQWTPSRQVKLVILGQMFVVFAISLDMTILTATLPVRKIPKAMLYEAEFPFRL